MTSCEIERLRFAESCREFHFQFEKQLSGYRSQRAWRVMLALRKAYALLARRRVPDLLRWAAGGFRGLDEFELRFPEILSFVPEDLYPLVARDLGAPVRSELKIPDPSNYGVVILPILDFERRFQRPQQIAVQFARAGHRVFWISPSRFLPDSSSDAYEAVRLRENLWEIDLRGGPFDLYRGTLDSRTAGALLDSLRCLYAELALDGSCVIVQFPSWRQVGIGLRERFGCKLIYDCMDDWPSWQSAPRPGAFSLAEEARLVRESDIVIVTARELRDRFAKQGVASELIPNAADFDTFANAPSSAPIEGIPQPIIGFYGAVAEWFDVDLMAEVAQLRPQYSFVLIGPVSVRNTGGLKSRSNVYLLGEKPYRELPGYLRQFAACLLPFRISKLTRSVDPVKVYEYLSQGKPVVSTPLPDLAAISDLLYFAKEPEEFARQIDRALAERDESLRIKRVSFASRNTWVSRIEAFDRAIRASGKEGTGGF
jgi:glycosyltransferase involved in cell wall biosynthesis